MDIHFRTFAKLFRKSGGIGSRDLDRSNKQHIKYNNNFLLGIDEHNCSRLQIVYSLTSIPFSERGLGMESFLLKILKKIRKDAPRRLKDLRDLCDEHIGMFT
jgi:hypothetical protein